MIECPVHGVEHVATTLLLYVDGHLTDAPGKIRHDGGDLRVGSFVRHHVGDVARPDRRMKMQRDQTRGTS